MLVKLIWPTNGCSTFLDIFDDNRIGANFRVRADLNIPKHLGARADVNVTSYTWRSCSIAGPDRYLLKNQAIHANLGFGMNNDPVGMRNEQTTTDLAVQRNIGTGDYAPKTMANHYNPPEHSCYHT
jgi:hypothetical protein